MTDYAVGDVHGCFQTLKNLLQHIQFHSSRDRLYFVGDLVNRGRYSIELLQWIMDHDDCVTVVLGNHDIHLLCLLVQAIQPSQKSTLKPFLKLPLSQQENIITWIRTRQLMHVHDTHNVVLVHAGIWPFWTLEQALQHAGQIERLLRETPIPQLIKSVEAIYDVGQPHCLEQARLTFFRWIIDSMTRIRFCHRSGYMCMQRKDDARSDGYYRWFEVPHRQTIDRSIIFGHWSALNGLHAPSQGVYNIDTGCAMGGALTAIRLDDFQTFSEPLSSLDLI